MATFKFGRAIDLHWNGYDIQGPAETVFSIPDQLYEEFDADIAPVEPTLVWLDTNEFETLKDSVVTSTIVGSSFITTASTTAGTQISIISGAATDGYVLTADGSGGVAFEAAPGGAGSLSAVAGTAPIAVSTSSGTATVSLNANYQTAGTYVTSVVGTSPISATGTTAITVTIDQTALTAGAATTSESLRTYVKNSSGSTITKGQVVYVTGADGTNALIGLASASSDPTSSKTLGIAANTMTNNAFGYVIENGQLSNIDTSAATAGSSVWLSATPGAYVFNSPPAEPDHAVYLGVVTKANVSTGEILVKVQNGYELDELHDVFVGGVSTALPLVYSSTSSGWIAQALSSVGIADNAVVSAKINDGAVTSAKIADNAIVAQKIADNSVGVVKINSGTSTNGQVLTANGTGGATFTTLTSGGLTVSQYSTTVENYIPNFVNLALTSVASPRTGFPTAFDPDGNVIYISAGSSTVTAEVDGNVKKIDIASNSIVAATQIAMSTNERIIDMAFGSSVLCVLTNSSVATVAPVSRWIILNSSLSTLAEGNVHSTHAAENHAELSTVTPYHTVDYDPNANQFVITGVHSSAATNAGRRFAVRLVDPGTYTTGFFHFPGSIAVGATTTSTALNNSSGMTKLTRPVYDTGTSRWVVGSFWSDATTAPYANGAQVIFLSQSTTTNAILSITGRQVIKANTNTSDTTYFVTQRPGIALSGTSALYFRTGGGTSNTGAQGYIARILMADISASANTNTTTEASALYSSGASSIWDSGSKAHKGLKVLTSGTSRYLVYAGLNVESTGPVVYPEESFVSYQDTQNGVLQTLLQSNRQNKYNNGITGTYGLYISTSDVTSRIGGFSPSAISFGSTSTYSYAIMAVHSSANSNLRWVRMARFCPSTGANVVIHSTTDPVEIVFPTTNMTNSDTSPVVNLYTRLISGSDMSNGYIGTNVLYTVGTSGAYCSSGSKYEYYVESAVSTSTTNVNTVTVTKVR